MKNENFCRFMILILLLSLLSPLLQFTGIELVDTAKAEILDDFQTGWDHHAQFTIDHDFIDEDLEHFPILVVINSTIGAAANGGDSLRFLSEDLTEQYYHEIDVWNAAGDSYVWVRINNTSAVADTNVVMFYGNATAVDQSSTNVWDGNYLGVWHMNDDGAGTGVDDSTSNGNDGTKNGVGASVPDETVGKIGQAQEFLSANIENLTLDSLIEGLSDMTVESWYKPLTLPSAAAHQSIMTSGLDNANTAFRFFAHSTGDVMSFAVGATNNQKGSTAILVGEWSYTTGTYDGSQLNIFFNGSIDGKSSYAPWAMTSPGGKTLIGSQEGRPDYSANGVIDEVRVSDVTRSDAWIEASFHSGNQTTGFFTWNGGIDSAIVNTNAATNIDTTSATFNGYIQLNGSWGSTTSCGFRWRNASESTWSANVTVSNDIANYTAFNYGATLNEGCAYRVEAWANNNNGFSTGAIKSFWTNAIWANYSLNSRKKITINQSFICEDLINFPLLAIVNNTSTGYMCDDGNSIRFYKNSTTEYYYDIDSPWNNTDDSYVWVNVTRVYDDIDTVFYMYYNDSTAVNSESNLTWDADYLGVYHLNETGGVRCNSSSRYAHNNGTYVGDLPTQVTTNIGYGQDLDGTDDYITFPSTCWLSGDNEFGTYEVYIKHDIISSQMYMTQWDVESKNRTYTKIVGTDVFAHGEGNGVAQWAITSSSTILQNEWYHIVTAMKKNDVKLLFNGSVVGSDNSCNMPSTGVENMTTIRFGTSAAGIDDFNGIVDEIRISNISRSQCWLYATFHSMNNTTGFFTWGEEELGGLQVQTNDPIIVYTQNATLSGVLVTSKGSATTRFQVNNSSVSYLTGRNTTNQTVTSGQTFYNNTSLPPLNPGDRYWYRAYANNTTTEVWGENVSFLTQPNASSGLSLAQGHLQITLSWTNNDGGDGCYIEFSENADPGAAWAPGDETPVPGVNLGYETTPHIHSGLNPGSTYYYKLWAYAQDDGWRSEVGNTSAPLNQTGITGNAKGVNMLQVSTNNTTGVEATNVTMWGFLGGTGNDAFATVRFQFNNSTGAPIYTPEGFWYWNTSNKTVTTGNTFFNNTSLNASLDLNSGDRYYYRAYANNTSTEKWGENLSFLTKPFAQTGFNATASEGGQITLNWTNHLGGDGCYIEFYENMPGSLWNSWSPGDYAANGSYQTTPYDHTGLNNTSVYSYKGWAYAEDDSWRSEVGNTSAPLNMSALTSNSTCIGGINVTTNATTGVEEMNATLWGWLNYTGDGPATVRFQYNNTTAFDINTTNQTKSTGETFSQNITGLQPGMFYHYRAYGNNTVNNTTGAQMVFLTKPNASDNLAISLIGGGDNGFNLTWTNNTGCNKTIVVRNNTSIPSDRFDGWEVYNGTNQTFIDTSVTNLNTYYYRIWAYSNWTWDGTNYFQFSDGNESGSRIYVSAPVIPLNSTSVTTTTATLEMYFDGAGTEYTVGFWVSCVSPTSASPGTNITVGTYTIPGTYTQGSSGWEAGQYYYIKTWGISATEFIVSGTTIYMIMDPNPPTSLQSTAVGGDSIQLNWVRFLLPGCVGGSPGNRTTVIRYLTTTYPTGATGENGTATGIWLYNGTLNNFLHTGLTADTTYYYSMWTYINDTGSDYLQAWSSYSTVSSGTEGGNYTIFLRYENVSYGRIPFTRGREHQFIVHYDDRTEFNYWDDTGNLITTGTYRNESNFTTMGPATGNFSFNAISRPLWMEFHWNDTARGSEADFRCNRIIIPQTGQRNITFYLRIDLPVFRETVFTINGTLVKYAYSFVDETGFFDVDSNALGEIFFYNSSGLKIIVHSEYWDTELKMYPWLVYGKKYFLGVYCNDFSVANLGIAPSEQNEEPQIIIPFSYTESNNFFDYINLTIWWQDATTLGLTYLDTDYSSTNVTLRLYWWNNTLISTNYYENLSNFNHFWAGLNRSRSYKIEVRTINDIWPDGLSSGKIPVYGVLSLSISSATLDTIMTTIFGQSPMWVENIDGSERTIPWSQVVIFGVAFILLVTLGKLNAFLGMSITGGWLIFASIAITGVELLGGAALITIGIFLVALSIVGLLGGVERR